jgi:predicted amidohydrolase YtcJ
MDESTSISRGDRRRSARHGVAVACARRLGRFIKRGIFMAFGSDNLPIGPMVGVYAAVTRKGESGKVYGPGEAVSIKDAITMYTRNGAFLTREEKLKGTLEPGKLADMIVLPEDPLSIAPDKLLGMNVDMTIVGGRILYDRSKAA